MFLQNMPPIHFLWHIQYLTIFVSDSIFNVRFVYLEKIMHISLTPELESRVKSKVESGLYNNASEVIREALRFMEIHEEWIREIKLGLNGFAHSVSFPSGRRVVPR